MKHVFWMCFGLLLCVVFASSALADGKTVYMRCAGCHGADGAKHALGASPPIKGQSAADLLQKLQGYADGSYGGAKKAVMIKTLKGLSPEQLKDVADYVAGLGG
ncbi:c-type cytochrome [Desulfocurvus sp. DL9XJH121]